MAVLYWIATGASPQSPTVGANWSTGSAPANGDTVFVQAIAGLTLADIDAADMHTVTLAALIIQPTFSGLIGTSATPGGYWRIGSALASTPPSIPQPGAITGSGRIKLDFGSSAVTVNVSSTSNNPADPGFEPFRFIGSAIVAVNVTGGTVGIATSAPDETSTAGIINASGQSIINASPGVTWTTATSASSGSSSATIVLNSAGTTLTTSPGATAVVNGSGLVGTSNCGGTTQHNNRTGGVDVTTLNLFNTGIADFSGNPGASTITNFNWYNGGVINTDPANPNHVTTTNQVLKNGGRRTLA